MKTEFRTYSDPEDWAAAAAEVFFRSAQRAIGARHIFTAALSGGHTPLPVYERLSRPPYLQGIDWQSVHLFWGDERCVPFDDPQSNYGMARGAFLSRVPLPPKNVHPVPVAEGTCRVAADRYEQDLRQFFKPKSGKPSGAGPEPDAGPFPIFDLILLGLGEDGHTASLFPGNPALEEKFRWAVYVLESPRPPFVPRVTLTLPVINRAGTVLFLVSGRDKWEIAKKIMKEKGKAYSPYPAARVHSAGELIWLIAET
jgi:6-phosphogluconolactonase